MRKHVSGSKAHFQSCLDLGYWWRNWLTTFCCKMAAFDVTCNAVLLCYWQRCSGSSVFCTTSMWTPILHFLTGPIFFSFLMQLHTWTGPSKHSTLLCSLLKLHQTDSLLGRCSQMPAAFGLCYCTCWQCSPISTSFLRRVTNSHVDSVTPYPHRQHPATAH